MSLPLTAKQHVLITFSAPSSLLSSDNWRQLHAALLSQLPLRNIHWKSASRPSLRTIQELDITLLPLDTLRDEHTSQVPVTLLEKPLLNMYIVTCEDADIETYRNTVKKQIKDWHAAVTMRKNQEWLILHIVRPDARAQSGNFFQLKGSVFDKIKADFNSDKRERCVQLAWSTGHDNPAAWAELINKIKDGILSAFDSAVMLREEEIKRSESQREMPGWNFCNFFVLKESLASSFGGLNLFEDALIQYDELEASFYQVLKEKNLSWFGTLISPGPKDDSLPLLTISKKPYRDLILANTISVFDFRIYLLACQCELLAKMGRINEVSRKAGAFLGAFGRRLREVEAVMPQFFVESWIHSSALSVVQQCNIWAAGFVIEGPRLANFNAGKGELLELARNQLDVIGIKVGHLPLQPPFSMAFQQPPCKLSNATQNPSSLQISNVDILSSLENKEKFYELYVSTTNRAIDMYAKAARRKFALKLHGSLAALDVHRGQLSAGLTTYTSLPAHYAPHVWTSLESYMLSRALDTSTDLKKSKDREWIHVLLSFLKTYIDNLGTELLVHEENKTSYLSELLTAMRHAASELDYPEMVHMDHPAIRVQVSSDAEIASSRDGSFLNVTIRNRLPCTLYIDEVSVVLRGRDSEYFRYTSPIERLLPGETELTLFCPNPSSGTHLLDSSEIRMSRLFFRWTYPISSGSGGLRKGRAVLVRLPRDLFALGVRLQQPNHVELGRSPKLLVALSSGRNHISRAVIKLTAPGVTFRCQDVVLDGENDPTKLEVANDFVAVVDVAKDKTITFVVPHSDASTFHAMKVHIEVEYFTTSEPSVVRTLRLTRVVATSLPIAVNVEDFFRGKRLFSKFTISTTSHQPVRISSARLEGSTTGFDNVKVVSCSAHKRGVTTVTPAQPANFLFYLDSSDGPVRGSLSLCIRYCMLREEIESLVKHAVETVSTNSPSMLPHRITLVEKIVGDLERDASWVEVYGVTGELRVPGLEDEKPDELLGQVKKLLAERKNRKSAPLGEWREIKIPVDVPTMNILAAACVKLSSSPADPTTTPHQRLQLYAGQPISAILSIHTSFHWGSSANEKGSSYTMRFDVEEMTREWLVSGRKRGDFVAKDDATYTVSITLIALHHGQLTLPKVAVTALPTEGHFSAGSMTLPSIETYQVHGAERVLVLPRGGRSTFVVEMGPS